MPKKERKLTKAEEKRKAVFETVDQKMREDGYKRTDLTVGVVLANILAIVVMLPFVIISVVVFGICVPSGEMNTDITLLTYVVLLVGIIVLAVIHEGIHGLTWGAFAKNHYKSIEFGVIWKMLTPYCACTEALKRWQYILGSAMPTVVLGIALTALAIVLKSALAELLAVVLILGGGGDLIIIIKSLMYKSQGGDVLFYDHPYECGVVAFEKIDN